MFTGLFLVEVVVIGDGFIGFKELIELGFSGGQFGFGLLFLFFSEAL
jgi:hypothetical protein